MGTLSRAALVALLCSSLSFAQQIRGEYMASRTADGYVRHCYANAETGLSGKQALLAWKIDSGSWNGVKLDGLHAAGAVTANAPPGGPYGAPFSGKVVMIVPPPINARRWSPPRSTRPENSSRTCSGCRPCRWSWRFRTRPLQPRTC